jgi:choline dehydrogenase
LSKSALADLATFPDDWPEIEWLSVGGFFGFQQNYIRKAPTDGKNYATMSMALVAPLSRGNVSIASADMNDHPLINPNWLSSTTDQQVAVAAYKRVRSFFATSTMMKVEMGLEAFPGAQVQSDAQILEIIKESFNTVYHASSTCAMGRTNDTMAVVDSHGRVIGVNGLRVVDASAMPFLPPGHPMSTICK